MSLPVTGDTLRTFVGAACVFAALVVFTDQTVRSLAPVLMLSAGMLTYSAMDEAYDLPRGTNRLVYGLGLVAVGVFLPLRTMPWIGGVALLAGFWFVLDGAVTIRYGPARTPHEFVSGAESEAMLRMRILHTVHRALRESDQPQTPAELAEACDLTESRVSSALAYLEQRGQVSRTEGEYKTVPQTWGRLTPVVQFGAWLPNRILRPVRHVRNHR
jgi:DNA-binding transcriptional ArsR family regulator